MIKTLEQRTGWKHNKSYLFVSELDEQLEFFFFFGRVLSIRAFSPNENYALVGSFRQCLL